jgi:hypothetical protein
MTSSPQVIAMAKEVGAVDATAFVGFIRVEAVP